MRAGWVTVSALGMAWAATLGAFAAEGPADLDNLYQTNRWFEFRDAMARQAGAAPFYKGELALAFHDWPEAEKQLAAAMRNRRNAAQAFEAALGLEKIYALSGRRKEARTLLLRIELLMQALSAAGKIEVRARRQFETYRAELKPFAGFPDMAVSARGRSRLYYAEVDNQLIVPVQVNGVAANYTIDTGSEVCVVSAREAKRLGLDVKPAAVPLSTYGTYSEEGVGVALARDLTLGNFHLRNVMFVVTADGDDGSDAGGILGLDVLLALGTVRWNSDGTMELGFPSDGRNLAAANLALVNGVPLVQISLGGRKESAVLDTGAYDSVLLPTFGAAFPALMKAPLRVEKREIGNGAEDPKVSTIEPLTVGVGGLETVLWPARVLSREPVEDSHDALAWLGMDLLGQARSVSIDFPAMKLTLQGTDGRGGVAPGTCALPPDFLCAQGWRCTVKAEASEACYIDRVPLEKWPGNAVTADLGEGKHCALAQSAACGASQICRVRLDGAETCRLETERAGAKAAVSETTETAAARPPAPPGSLTMQQARDAVERSLKFESLDLSPARDYLYLEDKVDQTLGADGSVKDTVSETREVVNLYDGTFERLVKKDGQALPPGKARAEQARFDKAVEKRAHETPAAKAKRLEGERKAAAQDLACGEELMKMFDFRPAGEEEVRGRKAWTVELEPHPNPAPRCTYLKTLTKFHMKLWIDQAEYRWARFEADNIVPVTLAALLIRVPTGGVHWFNDMERHEDGAWLMMRFRLQMNAKVLLLTMVRKDVEWTYSGYRKFQTDSRLITAAGK